MTLTCPAMSSRDPSLTTASCSVASCTSPAARADATSRVRRTAAAVSRRCKSATRASAALTAALVPTSFDCSSAIVDSASSRADASSPWELSSSACCPGLDAASPFCCCCWCCCRACSFCSSARCVSSACAESASASASSSSRSSSARLGPPAASSAVSLWRSRVASRDASSCCRSSLSAVQ